MGTLKPRHDAAAAVAPYLEALTEQRDRHFYKSRDWINVDAQIYALESARERLEGVFLSAGQCLVLGGSDVSLRH